MQFCHWNEFVRHVFVYIHRPLYGWLLRSEQRPVRSQMQGIWRFISLHSLILSLVLNDIYGGSLGGMEKRAVWVKASHASVSSPRSERSSSSEAPSGDSSFLYYSNVALSIKHCVQRKNKKKKRNEKRRNVRILANEIINLWYFLINSDFYKVRTVVFVILICIVNNLSYELYVYKQHI